MEGHVLAMGSFNYVFALVAPLVVVYLAARGVFRPLGEPAASIVIACSMILGTLPPAWLGYNLRGFWGAGHGAQLLLSWGMMALGCYGMLYAPSTLWIHAFLLADYALIIVLVLSSKGGASCFDERHRPILTHAGDRPTSSLYTLMVFWGLFALISLRDRT